MREGTPTSPLDYVPDPELVRDRLSQLFAEAALLRSLLRLAERKERLKESTANGREVHRAR
jgi:hypothetical protein